APVTNGTTAPLGDGGAWEDSAAKGLHFTTLNLARVMAQGTQIEDQEEGGSDELTLNDLFQESFLETPPEGDADVYGEPLAIVPSTGVNTLRGGAREEADALLRAGRSRVAPRPPQGTEPGRADALTETQRSASIEAEERRGAFVTLLGNETARMAAGGLATAAGAGLHPSDTGLCYLIHRDAVDLLFGAPAKNVVAAPGKEQRRQLRILKRRGRALSAEAIDAFVGAAAPSGTIQLFRHPEESFEKRQPVLKPVEEKPLAELTEKGIVLRWDLEPAWGSSATIIDDPEADLKHYEIERYFEGLRMPMPHLFETKSATPNLYELGEADQLVVRRNRTGRHLADDLTEGGVPPEFRAAVLGLPLEGGPGRAGEIWDEMANGSEVRVVYLVTPVDTMGTRGDPTAIEVVLPAPVRRVTAPARAELTVTYDHQPERADDDGDATAALSLTLPEPPKTRDGRAQGWEASLAPGGYRLRIRRSALRGGGQYGAEALDDARSRPGQKEMDTPVLGRDIDLLLRPVAGTPGDSIEVTWYRLTDTEEKAPETARYTVTLATDEPGLDKVQRNGPELLRRAMGVADDAATPMARRV
ncbi:MAG: hypothetical protein AAFZ09_08740, partial [Pseudomonadota bacterium]